MARTCSLAWLVVLAACSTTAGNSGGSGAGVVFDVAVGLADTASATGLDAATADQPKNDAVPGDATLAADSTGLDAAGAADALPDPAPDAVADAEAAADDDALDQDETAAESDTPADSDALAADDTAPPWQPPNDCAAATQKVYLVTKDYQLLAYAPQTKQIQVIGTLECPAEYATWPFSMGVDRKGTAWVMYSSGELFQVSTATAQCSPTTWTPGDAGFIECGMGFAANAPGSKYETLYLGSAKGKLGAVDFATWSAKALGSLGINPGWPELTGTGKGELWGFFPMSQPAKVAQIDKATGAVSNVKELTNLQMGSVKNWAFAHWGGRFLLFFQGEKDPSTSIYLWDPQADSYGLYQANTGHPVVGAGVSSCAPTSWLTQP